MKKPILFMLLSLCLLTSPAFAANRYATPSGGATTGECPIGTPCDLTFVVEDVAQSGETVYLEDGEYTTNNSYGNSDYVLDVKEGVSITAVTQTAPTPTTDTAVVIRAGADLGTNPLVELISGSLTTTAQTISYITFDGGVEGNLGNQGMDIQDRSNVTITYNKFTDFTGESSSSKGSRAWAMDIRANEIAYGPETTPGTAQAEFRTYLDTDWSKNTTTYPANPIANLTLTHNVFINCGDSGATAADQGPTLFIFHIEGSEIAYNYVDHSHARSEPIYSTPALWENTTFHHNIIIATPYGSGPNNLTGFALEIWVLFNVEMYNNSFINEGVSGTTGDYVYFYNNYVDARAVTGDYPSYSYGYEGSTIGHAFIHHNMFLGSTGGAFPGFNCGASGNASPSNSTSYCYAWGNIVSKNDMYFGMEADCNVEARANITCNFWIYNNILDGEGDGAIGISGIRSSEGGDDTIVIHAANNILSNNVTGMRDGLGAASWTTSNNLWYSNTANSNPSAIYTNDTSPNNNTPTYTDYDNEDYTYLSDSPQVNSGCSTCDEIDLSAVVGDPGDAAVDMSQKLSSATVRGSSTTTPSVVLTNPVGVTDIGPYEYGGLTISNPTPDSELPCDAGDPRNVTLGIDTNVNATCKYGLIDLAYASMPNTFSTTGGQAHSQIVNLGCDASYTIYTRCTDGAYTSPTSTPISFSIVAAPGGDTTAPVISSPLPVTPPEQVCESNPRDVTISVVTNDGSPPVTCRACLDGVSGCDDATAFADMLSNGGFVFDTNIYPNSSHILSRNCGEAFTYQVRCIDSESNVNSSSTPLTFSIIPDTPFAAGGAGMGAMN